MGGLYVWIGDGCVRNQTFSFACRRVRAGMPWGKWRRFGAFAFWHILCWFWTLQCKQHGGEVPAMQMYPCPSPAKWRMSAGPRPNQMQIILQKWRLYPSVGSGLIGVQSGDAWVRQRTCGLRRPTNDASADDPSGAGRPPKHSFGICLPPAPRSHLVHRSRSYRCTGSECGMEARNRGPTWASLWKIPPKTFVCATPEQEADLSSDRRTRPRRQLVASAAFGHLFLMHALG